MAKKYLCPTCNGDGTIEESYIVEVKVTLSDGFTFYEPETRTKVISCNICFGVGEII